MNKRQRKKLQAKMNVLKEAHFTDEQLWDMDVTLAKYISSGLKQFLNYVETKEELPGYPSDFKSLEEWHESINKMIWSFEEITKREHINYRKDEEYRKKIQEGLNLFAKYFQSLWE